MRRAIVLAALLFAISARAATVAVRVEPPQSLRAITLRSGDEVRSVAIVNGRFSAPDDFPLPWTVGMSRFETTAYSKADLDAKRPLVIRELGILRGTLQRAKPPQSESFDWLLQAADAAQPRELPFTVNATGAFEIRLPAGLYQGAALGAASATRIRSGIVIKAGQATDLGAIVTEPTTPVTVRVIDAKRNAAMAGARVEWDPPGDLLNAELNRAIYGRRWSGVTDRNGVISFASVGPLPMTIRWRVAAEGFASASTVRTQLREIQRVALPDVRLRPDATILVRAVLPDDKVFRGAMLGLHAREDDRSRRFTRKSVTELREGETRLRAGDYGMKRITIENASGKPVLYRDIEVVNELTIVDLAPHPVEIHGRVMSGDAPIANTIVRATEPTDGAFTLAEARTNEDGAYRMRAWQSGPMLLYTIAAGGPGRSSGNAEARVDTTNRADVRADLEMPRSGFSIAVVDAATGAPVKARIWRRLSFGEKQRLGSDETDAQGRLVAAAYPAGKASLHIQAKGYRARDVHLEITDRNDEHVIRLEKSRGIRGRVIDAHGAPIRGARITGGYATELTMQPHFFTQTDADGRFELDSAPEAGTLFYVAAARHALAITALQSDIDNTIVLHPPSAGTAVLMPDNAPPEKIWMVMAAPAGGGFIPLGALDDLADVNGMSPYQLHGSALDGSVVLPEFLPPGTYELFIAKLGGDPYVYHRVGRITAPLQRAVALSFSSH